VPFSLSKWYLDVVTDDGRVAIAYWAEVSAGGMQHAVCGLARAGGATTSSTFSLVGAHRPRLLSDRLLWHAPSLELDVELLRLSPEASRRLLDSPDGAVDWMAWAPSADVRMRIGDELLRGEGYAERVDLSIAPWALPLRTLVWGRWVSGSRSAIWLVWEGRHPLRLAWLDGVPAPAPDVGEGEVSLGAAGRLVFAGREMVTDASVGEQLTSLTPLRTLIDRVAQSHQTRWCSRGTLHAAGERPLEGWAIHEVVQWG